MNTVLESLLLLLAGGAAGIVNVAVGSGSLITFTVLIAMGLPPLTGRTRPANVTNSVAVLPGSLAGAYAYRSELPSSGIPTLLIPSCIGAATGAFLLLKRLHRAIFEAIVPGLVAFATLLVLAQPALMRLQNRNTQPGQAQPGLTGQIAFGATGVYGAYLGAAQGVVLLALLGLWTPRAQTMNAVKNLLNAWTNALCATVFLSVATVAWSAIPLIAAGAILGGHLGGRIAKTLPDPLLRSLIVACSTVTFISLLMG